MEYHHTKFGLIWIKESKGTEGGRNPPPPGWECIKSPRWDRVKLVYFFGTPGISWYFDKIDQIIAKVSRNSCAKRH